MTRDLEIKAEIKSLKRVLCDDDFFYQIPDYQRPYAWDKDNLSDLIDDLFNAYQNNDAEKYFCGSLVLVYNEKDKRYDIIDGQQRITTFIILSCVFRDFHRKDLGARANSYIKKSIQDEFDTEKRKLTLLTDGNYQNTFKQDVLGEEGIKINDKSNKKPENKYTNNRYLQNAHYLRDFTQEKLSENTEIQINDFIEWMFENVVLTTIICPSQDTAIQIFNVLNARGMELTFVDIIKSYLMIGLDSENRTAFKSDWVKIYNKLKDKDLSMEDLFGTYSYYTLNISNTSKSAVKELEEAIKKKELKKDSLKLIDEACSFTDSYIDILKNGDKYIYCLRYLKHNIWESILTIAKYKKYHGIEELKKILVAYYYLHWLNGSTLSKFKQTSLNIINMVKGEKGIDEIKKEIKGNLEKHNIKFENIDFKEDISQKHWIKPTLLLLEYSSTDDSNQNFIEKNLKTQIEHILPQNPKHGSWENFSDDDKKEWTHALGNLTLLSRRKNAQARNDSYEQKREVYKNRDNEATSFEITRRIPDDFDEWNVKNLKRRQEQMIEKLKEILDIF